MFGSLTKFSYLCKVNEKVWKTVSSNIGSGFSNTYRKPGGTPKTAGVSSTSWLTILSA